MKQGYQPSNYKEINKTGLLRWWQFNWQWLNLMEMSHWLSVVAWGWTVLGKTLNKPARTQPTRARHQGSTYGKTRSTLHYHISYQLTVTWWKAEYRYANWEGHIIIQQNVPDEMDQSGRGPDNQCNNGRHAGETTHKCFHLIKRNFVPVRQVCFRFSQ